ncbi:hypothetical protein [Streptomyces sp. NPDC085466]|uniref:hypothetical protein n=1 Tax=Streptomyces sp. NPDC085466 TaxID=3365725 RepID=UPI0037D79B9F
MVEAARVILDGWLDVLPGRRYESIAVAPFVVRSEGVLLGLVAENRGEENPDGKDWAELYPDGLGFTGPRDGTYDT